MTYIFFFPDREGVGGWGKGGGEGGCLIIWRV